MSADSEDLISQVRQTRLHSDKLAATLHDRAPGWVQAYQAWKALLSQAREARAETRNHRHIAVLRRALSQKLHQPSTR